MINRPRRLRTTPAMRELVADVTLSPKNLMLPVFVKEGITEPRVISGMPGVLQHTEESFLHVLDDAIASGIVSVMFFAVPEHRDGTGSQACLSEGILSRVIRAAREHVGDALVLVADLCLDEFTDHGHCGVLDSSGEVDNDATLEHYVAMATVLADAGADLLGTSGMMDGQVAAIRAGLDVRGFVNTGILAYAAKYASNFYGPFRNAVESQLSGDRKTYQQDFRRTKEGAEEILLDLEEGADMVMVKPALAYMDVLSQAAQLSSKPVAAYVVSGEYSMVETAAAQGVIPREATIFELLYALKRAGANIICTYWALEFAQKLKEQS
ncbi:porphobilinogen synthase [Aurantimicrobium minutum]|uniref:porphobilinogen synthase n=1 Tax=Aurantimicrobium minutum TaxID=708131 RepID=UPI002476821C|nr:porphobilinogen synthase [Aurantimicrobium minutum]MDH6423556.1 porphobilinogen synthase [Aurantimicrobium minutum]